MSPEPSAPSTSAANRLTELEAELHEKRDAVAQARQFVNATEAEILRLEGAILALRDRLPHEAAASQAHADLTHLLELAHAEIASLRPQPTAETTDSHGAESAEGEN